MDMRNRVDAGLRSILDDQPVFDLSTDLAGIRNAPAPEWKELPDVTIREARVPGPECELPAKIFAPQRGAGKILPGVLYCHGGGYVLGSPDSDGLMCELLARGANCVVVSVDYRLAPEAKFPAAVEDCFAGLRWMASRAGELGVDIGRIAVAGASAGGGLAAALALMARDRGGPALVFQMPLYPMLDDRNETPSSREITTETMPRAWNRENNLTAWRMYLGEADGEVSAYAAPARAKDLSCLPPTYLCVGGLDPFRDETVEYAARLSRAGVDVEFHLYPGCYHGFDAAANAVPISRRARDDYIEALRRALHNEE